MGGVKKLVFVLCLGLVISASGLGIKLAGYGQAEKVDQTVDQVSVPGFEFHSQISPVNRGAFDIRLMRHKTCPGGLAILRLQRNAEGAYVLAHALKLPDGVVKFVFEGRLHNSFPSFGYWFARATGRAKPVYAVAELGTCGFLETIDWARV